MNSLLNGPTPLDVAAAVDPILRRPIYWAGAAPGAADSKLYRAAANSLSIAAGAVTESTRFTTSGIDNGFFAVQFGQAIGSPDGQLRRGLSGGIECDDGTAIGGYGTFMAARFGSFQMYADAAPTAVLYKSQDAYSDATVNLVGAITRVAAGLGRWTITVVNFAALAGQAITYTVNGTPVTITEGVEWTAAVSNAATATSIRAAITASGATIASATGAVVGVVGINSTYTLTITSTDGANLPVAQAGSDGNVILYGFNVVVECGGVQAITIGSTAILVAVPLRGADASAAAPEFSFSNDTNTGMYRIGADQVGISTNGTLRLTVSTTQVVSTLPFQAPVGSGGAPAFTFTSDTNTGIYAGGSDQINFSTGGTSRANFTTTAFNVTGPIVLALGTAAAPAYTFTSDLNTGMYGVGADQIGLSTNGTLRLTVSTTAFTATLPWLGQAGSAAAPAISFSGDTDSGMYSVGANQVGISTGGAIRMTVENALVTLAAGVDLQLGNAYAAGIVAPTGSINVKDSTGTVYRVCVLV